MGGIFVENLKHCPETRASGVTREDGLSYIAVRRRLIFSAAMEMSHPFPQIIFKLSAERRAQMSRQGWKTYPSIGCVFRGLSLQ
jgi:hypothetical protein